MRLLIVILSVLSLAVVNQSNRFLTNPNHYSPPAVVNYKWKTMMVGGGGYVTGLVIHPMDKSIMYIRTDVGGAYRWDTAGKQWIQMLNWVGPEDANLIGVDGIALDPELPDRVYLALGKNIRDTGGVFRSDDRGKTWKRLFSTGYEGNGRLARWTGECLAVDPLSSAIIYAGTRTNGLWRSNNDGISWSKVTDVPVGPVTDHPTGIRSIVFDPAENSNGRSSAIYIGVPGSGVYQSLDGGASFHSMKGSPTEPARMQVVNRQLFVTHASGVARWRNGNWEDITPSPGKNYVALTVDPANDKKVVVAERYSSFYNPIYRSENSGMTWEQINTKTTPAHLNVGVPWWSPTRFSSATAAMAFAPGGGGELYYTDWFGVWCTPNVWSPATEWFTLENGHEETVVLTLVAPPEGALVYSGMADNFGFRHDSINRYPQKRLYHLNEGFSIAVCEKAPSCIAVLGAKSWGGNGTQLSTSSDYGERWTDRPLPPGTSLGRIAIAAANPDNMVYVAGGGKAYYTRDRGFTWQTCAGAPQNAINLTDIWNRDFALAADTVDSTFYIFNAGILYASQDGGANWQPRNQTAIAAAAGFLNVTPTPGRQGEVWISLDKNGLWKTGDGGKTFSRIEGVEMARLFCWGAPAPGSRLPTGYCYGTINGRWGLFRSVDMGKTWVRINDDAHQFPSGAKALAADRKQFGTVYIGTGGCGILCGQIDTEKK